MSNLVPLVALIVGTVVLVLSVMSGQRSGFGVVQIIGIVIGAGGVLGWMRLRRRASRPSGA